MTGKNPDKVASIVTTLMARQPKAGGSMPGRISQFISFPKRLDGTRKHSILPDGTRGPHPVS